MAPWTLTRRSHQKIEKLVSLCSKAFEWCEPNGLDMSLGARSEQQVGPWLWAAFQVRWPWTSLWTMTSVWACSAFGEVQLRDRGALLCDVCLHAVFMVDRKRSQMFHVVQWYVHWNDLREERYNAMFDLNRNWNFLACEKGMAFSGLDVVPKPNISCRHVVVANVIVENANEKPLQYGFLMLLGLCVTWLLTTRNNRMTCSFALRGMPRLDKRRRCRPRSTMRRQLGAMICARMFWNVQAMRQGEVQEAFLQRMMAVAEAVRLRQQKQQWPVVQEHAGASGSSDGLQTASEVLKNPDTYNGEDATGFASWRFQFTSWPTHGDTRCADMLPRRTRWQNMADAPDIATYADDKKQLARWLNSYLRGKRAPLAKAMSWYGIDCCMNMNHLTGRGELSCNDGCVYKTRRNQYEAEFSPFSWWRVVQFHFVLFHNASFETNTESKSRTTMTLRSVLTQDGYMGAVWWALRWHSLKKMKALFLRTKICVCDTNSD